MTRDALLGAAGLQTFEDKHPTLGAMYIRELSTRQSVALSEMTNQVDQMAYMLLQCLVDKEGEFLFESMDEVKRWLDDVPAAVSTPIMEAIAEHNGADLDATRENFTQARNGDSPTD